jgi:hypothetical protein
MAGQAARDGAATRGQAIRPRPPLDTQLLFTKPRLSKDGGRDCIGELSAPHLVAGLWRRRGALHWLFHQAKTGTPCFIILVVSILAHLALANALASAGSRD